jgi:precorrin-6B methylase 2
MLHKKERNGKAPALFDVADSTLKKMQKLYSNVDYKLHKGFTTDTLKPTKFDFVYIDGGHSYETVKHDYSMVKDSSIIVFDDVKITSVNTFINELIADGVIVEIIDSTVSKHVWAVIRN